MQMTVFLSAPISIDPLVLALLRCLGFVDELGLVRQPGSLLSKSHWL